MESKDNQQSRSKIVVIMTILLVLIAICINAYIIIRGLSNNTSQSYNSIVENAIKSFNEKEDIFNKKGEDYLKNIDSIDDSAINEMTQIVYSQRDDIDELREMEAENEIYKEQTELIYLYNQTNSINLTLITTFLLKDKDMISKGFNEKRNLSQEIKKTEDTLLEKISFIDIDDKSNNTVRERNSKNEKDALLGCWINLVDETQYYFSKDKLYKVNKEDKEVIKYSIESNEDGYLVLKIGSAKDDKMYVLFNNNKSEINIKYKKDGTTKYEVLNYLRDNQEP